MRRSPVVSNGTGIGGEKLSFLCFLFFLFVYCALTMNMKTTNEMRVNAVLALFDAIIDSIKVAGDYGAPGGTLYAALMAYGCTLDRFNNIMTILVASGRVERRGQLYFATA